MLRVVAYVRAELDAELADDPLLPTVGWSWLTDALAATGGAVHRARRNRDRYVVGAVRRHLRAGPDRRPRAARLVDAA